MRVYATNVVVTCAQTTVAASLCGCAYCICFGVRHRRVAGAVSSRAKSHSQRSKPLPLTTYLLVTRCMALGEARGCRGAAGNRELHQSVTLMSSFWQLLATRLCRLMWSLVSIRIIILLLFSVTGSYHPYIHQQASHTCSKSVSIRQINSTRCPKPYLGHNENQLAYETTMASPARHAAEEACEESRHRRRRDRSQ